MAEGLSEYSDAELWAELDRRANAGQDLPRLVFWVRDGMEGEGEPKWEFCVATQEYWDRYGYLEDFHVNHHLPDPFFILQEGVYGYTGRTGDGIELLARLGHTHLKEECEWTRSSAG